MYVLHINSKKNINKVDKFINQGYDVFILVYMEGCGPCNATRPEWAKLESALQNQYAKNNKLVIVDVNKDYLSDIKHIGPVDGFPTMKYIGNYGKKVESYEDSSISKKDRSIDSFINWIESKINIVLSTTPSSSPHNVYRRIMKSEKQSYKKTKHNKNRIKKIHKGGKRTKRNRK